MANLSPALNPLLSNSPYIPLTALPTYLDPTLTNLNCTLNGFDFWGVLLSGVDVTELLTVVGAAMVEVGAVVVGSFRMHHLLLARSCWIPHRPHGDDVGIYGSYRFPYAIQRMSRVSQYGYVKSRTVKIAHNIRETVSHLTVIQALLEVVNLT